MTAPVTRWQRRAAVVLATVLLALSGCGGAEPPPAPDNATATGELASQRTGPTPTLASDRATRGLARPAAAQPGPVTIYLPRLFEDNSLGLRAAARAAALPTDPAREAIEALIQGPTGDERAVDFEYALEPRTRLRSVTVGAGTATVDFESGIEKVHGRPFSELVYWSIVYTLTEVPAVDRVALSYRGQPLQEIGFPPVPVLPAATRADVPDWARPR